MKNQLLKTTAFILFTGMFLLAGAQEPQTASKKTSAEQLKEVQVQKVSEMVNNIASSVKITDEQKAKLQASLLEGFIKSDNARAEIKGDDAKLQAWRDAKIADIKARVRAILTPEQYEQAMKIGSGK